MTSNRELPRGIYVPLPCFFQAESEELDLDSYIEHVKYTAAAGTIPLVSGTMGEAPHLNWTERICLIGATRSTLDSMNLQSVPVLAGTGATSTRESIQFAGDAAEAGADFVLVIPPGYYAGTLLANKRAIRDYFVDIAEESPLPVMMYNFPAVAGGIDLDSEMIIEIAQAAPNICGIKLTCGDMGKLTRITAVVESPHFKALFPRKEARAPFRVFNGSIDFLLPSITSSSAGAITGLANFAPKACVKLWKLCASLEATSASAMDFEAFVEAHSLQKTLALADGVAAKAGIAGIKFMLHRQFGYSIWPRKPLLTMGTAEGLEFAKSDAIHNLTVLESTL